MKRFRSPAHFVRELRYGPEPVGKAGAAILQLETAAELGGRQGLVHYGAKGNPATSFTGWAATPQTFRGAAQMGANSHAHVENYPALPSTTAPPALPTWLQDWTQLEGMVP